MIPARPYLIRAIHEWLLDNNMTPYMLVDAMNEQAEIPQEYVENGKIVLNISPVAVNNLNLGNEWISFDARFGGRSFPILIPIQAVLGIFARESNQHGIMFDPDELVANDAEQKPAAPVLRAVDTQTSAQDDDDAQPQRPPRGKPTLRRIK